MIVIFVRPIVISVVTISVDVPVRMAVGVVMTTVGTPQFMIAPIELLLTGMIYRLVILLRARLI